MTYLALMIAGAIAFIEKTSASSGVLTYKKQNNNIICNFCVIE